jgi:microcystin-dependent protein
MMPDAFTPILGLIQPEIGSSRDTWGAKWNTNASTLDQYVSMAMPIGGVLDFAGSNAPPGWLICDGRTVSRVTYGALFAVIGTYWGAGDGSTTFRLPNTPGRALVGPGSFVDDSGGSYVFPLGFATGYVTNTILRDHLPNYVMVSDSQGYHAHGGQTVDAGYHHHTTDTEGGHRHSGSTDGNGSHSHTGITDSGGSHQHNISLNIAGAVSPGGGGTPGASTGVYITDPAGIHAHTFTTSVIPNHSHVIFSDGDHWHTTTDDGVHNHGIYGDGAHQHGISLGGYGNPIAVLSPVLVMTKIIYAGHQAVVHLSITTNPPAVTAADELAMLREEVAALRALFETPRQRLLRAPSRGPH